MLLQNILLKEQVDQCLLNTSTQLIDIFSGGKLSQVNRATGMNTVGLLSQIGILNPFNRKQESEADYLGLIFSSLSGYDIRETKKFGNE